MESDKGTVIDTDASFEGTLTGRDARVLGRFKGEIDIKGRLVLGEGCRVEARVIAGTVEVAGEFVGEIVAERLILQEKARISGTVDARTLSVREGAQLNGSVNAGDKARSQAASAAATAGGSPTVAKPIPPAGGGAKPPTGEPASGTPTG
jgi:cytoskeletal protein CcmA (bactofilin family)